MKTARLFFDGEDQAVELPEEFRFEGTEVHIRRDPETGEVILSVKPPEEGDGGQESSTGPAPEGLQR